MNRCYVVHCLYEVKPKTHNQKNKIKITKNKKEYRGNNRKQLERMNGLVELGANSKFSLQVRQAKNITTYTHTQNRL